MRHNPNTNLPKGSFRIICTKCNKVYHQGQGSITNASLLSDSYSEKCEVCHGEVVLETNPLDEKPKYDKDHQYPHSSNY